MKHIILASASPRRREILSALDVSFTVRVSDVDEHSDVTDPALWDINACNLYTVKTEIVLDGEVVDEYETKFGFRTIEFDAGCTLG